MNLMPLFDAPLAIQIHVATVLPAAVLGPVIFWGRKGDARHRLLGKIWLGLMVASAFSSFFIHSINMVMGFSPIHLLSLYVIIGSFLAIRSARQRKIKSHMRQVQGIYLGGIVGAGAFTLLPGRIMNAVVFGLPAGSIDLPGLASFALLMVAITAAIAILAKIAPAKQA
jgi:uncharacterized membrane protein